MEPAEEMIFREKNIFYENKNMDILWDYSGNFAKKNSQI